MDRIHTHYDNLKVTRYAPLEVIKAAYRAMAQKYHPDVNPLPGTDNVMKLVNEAWVVLSDPIKRAEHDQWIKKQEMDFLFKNVPQPTTTSTNSKDYFSDASEGYKAETPFWLRAMNLKFMGGNKKLGDPRVVAFGIIGILIIIGSSISWIGFLNSNSAVKNSDLTNLANTQHIADDPKPIVNQTTLNNSPEKIGYKEYTGDVLPLTAADKTVNWNDFSPITGDVLPLKPSEDIVAAKAASGKSVIHSNENGALDFSKLGTLVPDAQRQNNGYLDGERQSFSNGRSTFKIDNTNGSHDAEVRLYIGGKLIRSMYVRVGTAFTAEKLEPGTYKMRYKMNIKGENHAFQAKDDFVLSQTETEIDNGIRTRFSRMTVTLYKVKDGNLQTEEIPITSF